jgi:hypothetical protein
MFAKIFNQIFDSSIAENWQARIVFQDLLVLADKDGVVDMTVASIARRTNIPIEIITEAIPTLEAPDRSSRTPDHEGRRIMRLDAHRDWGWRIVNFEKYRESASKEMLRLGEADRKRAYRARFPKSPSPTPPTELQKEKQKQNSPGTCPGQSGTHPTLDVQPAAGFPTTEEEAVTAAAGVGCPEQFATNSWIKAMSRGGRDAKDIPIRSWHHYLATEWSYERNRQSEIKNHGRTNTISHTIAPDRNAGTFNAGYDTSAAKQKVR